MPQFESLFTNAPDPLECFSDEERQIIKEKIHVLSSLVYLIGKDYGMEVKVNPEPGWEWDFEENVVRVDPDDLLEKPIEFLRFVMSHEAGHRRISRGYEVIPREVWEQPGFAFMMNAIEDPRDNNFVADTIPHFKEEMKFAYGPNSDVGAFETEMKEKAQAKFKTQPRFMQAGFEYMRLWYQYSLGNEPTLREELPVDVREVVEKTLPHARESWNTYPSLKESEEGMVLNGKHLSGEEVITEYARASFNINHQHIWPLFKTLVDKDIEDIKNKNKGSEERSNNDGKEQGESSEKSQLNTPSEPGQKEEGADSVPLTEEEIINLIKEFAQELAKHFEGEIDKMKKAGAARKEEGDAAAGEAIVDDGLGEVGKVPLLNRHEEPRPAPEGVPDSAKQGKESPIDFPEISDDRIKALIKSLERRNEKEELYEKVRREYAPLIDQLTNELQEIFNKRRHTGWQAGFKSGKRVHIGRAIQEEVSGTSPFDTGAFMRRDQPQETDYAIELLIDQSGSMKSFGKIMEAYKATIVLSEVLNVIGIKFGITGFNTKLTAYKSFERDFDDRCRKDFEPMLSAVHTQEADGTNDAQALQFALQELLAQEEMQRIVFIISDGQSSDEMALLEAISEASESKVKLVGLGLGTGTEHVRMYYPNAVANIRVEDLAKVLSQKVREAIEG